MKLAIDSPELRLAIETRDAQIAYGKRNTTRLDNQIADMRAKEHPIATAVGKWVWRIFAALSLLIFWGGILAAVTQ